MSEPLANGKDPDGAGRLRRRRPPNVLLVISDQQRADTVAPHTVCATPSLDSLAAEGTRFERCYAANPICSPSRASLLTGLLPHAHGMVDCTHTVEPYRAALDPAAPFWSRTFRAAGYRTGYLGKWHVERSNDLAAFGFDHGEVTRPFVRTDAGYARTDGPGYLAHRAALGLPPTRPEPMEARHVRQPGYRDLLLYGVSAEPVEATTEHYVASRGIDFLREAAREPGRPWLLVTSFEAPHEPYLPPRAYRERYDASAIPRPASFDDPLDGRPGVYRRMQAVWKDLDWADFAEATACYYAYCSLIDDQVGRLMAAVRDICQWEDTLIVFLSDHGDLMGAHRMLLKGIPAFEEVYRVPLVLRGPGVPSGVVTPRVVGLLDVGPTLCQLALDTPYVCHGRSLVPLLRAEDDAREPRSSVRDSGSGDARSDDTRSHDAWSDDAYGEMHGQRFGYTQRVVWHRHHKYVFNAFDHDELYDLASDPHELRNLAEDPEQRTTLEAMASRMWERAHETGDSSLIGAQDGTYRYAPVGPQRVGTDDGEAP